MEYSFVHYEGRFSFDAETRTVTNLESGAVKYLSKNEAVLLECLLSGIQTKEKLMRKVWFDRGVVVTDASYYQLATQLSKGFAEVGLPKYGIKTIPRYGLVLAVKPVSGAIGLPKVPDQAGASAPSLADAAEGEEGRAHPMVEPAEASNERIVRPDILGWLRSGRHLSIRSRAKRLMANMLSMACLWTGY
jgi:DNA-binding winged helix-turn-helix (wHTH) protein